MDIETPRLLLRPFRQEDAADCFAFLSDEETCRLDGGYAPFTEMDGEYHELMTRFAHQPNRAVVVLKATGHVIGMVHVMHDEQGRPDTLELGYVSSPRHRRQGYMSEAVRAVMEHLLQTGTQRLILGIARSNTPSLRMAEKLGFTPAGDYPMVAGEPMAEYEYRA